MLTSKTACAPLLVLALASPALVNCGLLNNVAMATGHGCPATEALKTGRFTGLNLRGDSTGQLRGFLEAVYATKQLSNDAEGKLIAACAELGSAIDVDAAALQASPGDGDGAKRVCGAASDRVRAILKEAGNAKLTVGVTEPSCNLDIDPMLDCYKGCGAVLEPAVVEASCDNGQISGTCDGVCKGSCTITGSATCSGECSGNCAGKCDGKPMKEAGVCLGTCDGTCDAACTTRSAAQCGGTCTGSCSVHVKAPKCSGTFRPPTVDLSCQIACSTKAHTMMRCEPPRVKVAAQGQGRAKADLAKLVKALETSLPKIAAIELGMAKRVRSQAEALLDYSIRMPEIASATGTEGAVCIASATDLAQQALSSIKVSVDVSVSVRASVSAKTTGSAKTGG